MNGNPDPVDQAAQNSGQPSASPNPLASAPATTSVQIGSATAPAAPTLSYAADPKFIAFATSILEQKMGATNYRYVSKAVKDELIQRIWNDSGIQADFAIYQSNPAALGALTTQIQNVIMGQGDDPTVVNDYVAMKNSQGVGLTSAEQAALAGATQAQNAPVPRPFGTNVVSGNDYGTKVDPNSPSGGYGATHLGVDYGTRVGDRIVSPFAGTVTVMQANDPQAKWYGQRVTVTLDNGWKLSFGHVGSYAIQNGARVNPGDLLALAGANVGDSQGSVTLVEWQDPKGNFANPHEVLDPIFSGTTFSNIGAGGAAGTGMPTVNKILDAEYPTIKSDFQTYFGHPPSPEDVQEILQHGTSPIQWTDYIRSMGSHIDGMNMGQAYDLRQTADSVSSKILGHPATDGIVKDLYGQQITTPLAVQNWYNEHGVTGIEPTAYNAIYKANQPTMANIFNEPTGFDPRIAKLQADGIDRDHKGPQ